MIYSDRDIKKAIDDINLIEDIDEALLGPSCYELRLGNVYYDLTEGNKRIELNDSQKVIIKPGHLVVLITKEKLKIPNYLTGRVVSKGSLFSIGLTPVCTNVDPGFEGNMGIVLQNISRKYIELPQGEALVKIEFCKLLNEPSKIYNGQHGFQTNIWPIKTHLQKEHKDFFNDDRVFDENKEANLIIPSSTAKIINNILSYQKRTNKLLIGLTLLNLLSYILISNKYIDSSVAFGISVIAGLFVYVLTNNTGEVGKNGN